jgi:hypothetical protein
MGDEVDTEFFLHLSLSSMCKVPASRNTCTTVERNWCYLTGGRKASAVVTA